MTLRITIPLSQKTCNIVKRIIGLSLVILSIIGMVIWFVGIWFNWFDMDIYGRIMVGILLLFGIGTATTLLIIYAHRKGFWIEFSCKCEENKI